MSEWSLVENHGLYEDRPTGRRHFSDEFNFQNFEQPMTLIVLY